MKLQPSGSLHKCKETRHALLTLQNNFRETSVQMACALALGAGSWKPRLLQTSPWHCCGILHKSFGWLSQREGVCLTDVQSNIRAYKVLWDHGRISALKSERTRVQASPGVKDSPMDLLESTMRMSPWGCRDLHFVVTHSSGSKTAKEQWRCLARHRAAHIQALGRVCTEDLTQHHQHLLGHSSCGVSSSSCDHS